MCQVCQSFDTLPKQESFNIIYLIGVGWIENNKWHYKKFICDKPTKICELTIMKNFIVWVEQMGNPPLFCWHAEKTIWNRSVNDHKNHNLKNRSLKTFQKKNKKRRKRKKIHGGAKKDKQLFELKKLKLNLGRRIATSKYRMDRLLDP